MAASTCLPPIPPVPPVPPPFSCPYRSVSGAFFGLGGGVTHSGLSGGVEGVALLATLLGVVGLVLGVFGVDSSTSNSGPDPGPGPGRARFGMI